MVRVRAIAKSKPVEKRAMFPVDLDAELYAALAAYLKQRTNAGDDEAQRLLKALEDAKGQQTTKSYLLDHKQTQGTYRVRVDSP